MHIIKDLSKDKIYEIAEKVAENHKNKAFGLYSSEDIKQQVWQIILEQLPGFNHSRGKVKKPEEALERWLNRVVSNRLKNFYRDRHTVPNKNCQTVNQTDYMKDSGNVVERSIDNLMEEVVSNEYWAKIKSSLDENDMDILEALLSGEKINTYYKNKLFSKIKGILKCLKTEEKD